MQRSHATGGAFLIAALVAWADPAFSRAPAGPDAGGPARLSAAARAGAVDGIAIATRRKGKGDLCFGVGRTVYGKLVRHDIEDSRVVAGSPRLCHPFAESRSPAVQ